MKLLCAGVFHQNCDPTCVHATPHDCHDVGCVCEDCNTDNKVTGGVGCLFYDKCIETGEIVLCEETDKIKAIVTLRGCDDETEIEIAVTTDELNFLKRLSALSDIKSNYDCMPTLAVEVIE